MRLARPLAILVFTLAAAACSGGAKPPSSPALYEPSALPTGALGAQIAFGHDLLEHTRERLPKNVGARMNCSSCHLNAGTVARGASLAGAYARFPQWNARAGRVIALQDRLAECFLYSMNGTPPAYSSREMVAMVAYIAWISRGTPALSTPDPANGFKLPEPAASPDATAGARIYAQKCATCHGAGGAGIALSVPPLWGPDSFNDGAGMHRLGSMAGFVRYNMPLNAPGTLDETQAYQVAAYVLSHARPAFAKTRPIAFPAKPAAFF